MTSAGVPAALRVPDVVEVEVAIPGLAPELDGFRIAQITDLHVGPTIGKHYVEGVVEPLSFNLSALEEHADSTRALPLHTHRGGAGRLVLLAKWGFRKTCQVFINETLGRQRIFNGHVRDSYAQLSAEVLRLKAEVEGLKSKGPARKTGGGKRGSTSSPRKG